MLSTKTLPALTNTEQNEQLLNAALNYAKLGFAVFPVHSKRANGSCTCNKDDCKSIGKHPRTTNGVRDATKDPAVIRFWWSNAFQGSNIAIATGRVSDVFVVDVDVKHDGIAAWSNFKDDHDIDATETVAQDTPSGGEHIFYKMPKEGKVLTKTNVLAQGIDIRGDGGYIVAAPSIGYEYAMDQALGEIPIIEAVPAILDLVVQVITDTSQDSPLIPTEGLYDLGRDESNKIKDALQHVDPDDYSVWWSIGAALHSTNGIDSFEWWCTWAQESSKFVHEEHVKAWRDFDVRIGNTDTVIFIDYLYKLAEANGWIETFDHSDCFFDPNITNDEFQAMIKNTLAVRTITADFVPSAIPKRNWVITDYLLRGYINLLVSPGAVGKSMLTLIEAISVAIGRDLLDLGKVKQGNVVVINNEDDNDEIDRRIAAICQHFRIRLTDLENKLFIYSGYNERVVIANEIDRKVIPSLFTHKIINLIESKDIILLAIDPFVSTHESNENDNNNIDAVINCYKKIAGFTDVAIRLVHHTRKSGGEADSHAGDVESARGASSLKDAARVCHTLSGMGEIAAKTAEIEAAVRHRLVRIDDAKTNFSLPSGTAKWFYKESVQIANGEWLGVMRPYNLVIKDKPKEKTPAQRKDFTIHNIARAALAKLGIDGGKIKATELKAEYQNLANCGSSKADNDFTLLPVGVIKSQRLNINGKYYRIYQTREDKPRAARYIHIQADE